jgi:hypothetical protein
MRRSALRFLRIGLVTGGLVAVVGAAGCSAEPSADATAVGDMAETDAPTTLTLSMTVADSKVDFGTHVEAFAVTGARSLSLPCRNAAFALTSKPSLYDEGWSPDEYAKFADDVAGAKYRDYVFASCRDGSTQAIGWFARSRDVELSVTDQLLDEDYDATKLPLVIQLTSIGSDDPPAYYSCGGSFEKKLVEETDDASRYDISVTCKKRREPTKSQLGPVDFVAQPGAYAAVASYDGWTLPAVASTKASFSRVKDALLAAVPEGEYSGAMSTLSKLCDLDIRATSDGLVVDHTIESSNRTRHLELQADDLLGFVEGDLYADPVRPKGDATGTFAAAELRDADGGSFVVRFEHNDGRDAEVVRINGSEAYCRRLVKN